MGQVTGTTEKFLKEILRDKAALFWTIAFPIFWVIIDCFAFVKSEWMPEEVIPLVRGSYTISIAIFAIMLSTIVGLSSSIASDREKGLLSKLLSMPINPWIDSFGRLLGSLAFSALAAGLVFVVGSICGARFHSAYLGILESVGFFLLAFLASVGIGLTIGTFVKREYGATMTGVGIAVGTAAMSGLFFPYSLLPSPLQIFARIYPFSSCNSSVIFLLAGGEEAAGYNPLTAGHIAITIALSMALFIIGLALYKRFCWGRR